MDCVRAPIVVAVQDIRHVPAAIEWARETMGQQFTDWIYCSGGEFAFAKPSAATLFKLTWGGDLSDNKA